MIGRDKKENNGLFYGWIILIACCSTTTMIGGMFYSFGVFFKPLLEDFGWSRALTSSVNTVYILFFAVSNIVLGRLTDQYGPKRVLMAGALLIGLGFVLCSQVTRISHLYLCYIIAGLGSGATWALPTATIQRWFFKHRGFTLGLVTAGVGLGTMIFSPILGRFIELYGWQLSYIGMGLLCWLVLTVSSLFLVFDPRDKGLLPYGADEPEKTAMESEGKPAEPSGGRSRLSGSSDWSVGEALRTRTFYELCILYMFSVFPIYMVAVHIVAFATDQGISKTAAAGALGLIGGASVAGRIAMGGAAEKMGWKSALSVCCFMSAAAVVWLLFVKNYRMLYTFVFLYGFFYGGKVPQIPGLVGYFFGTKYLASLIGIIHSIAIAGGAGSPILAGYIYDKTGNYHAAFIPAALSFVLAGVLSLLVTAPQKKEPV